MPASKVQLKLDAYYPYEELLNALTHGLGMLAAIFATVFMLDKASTVPSHLTSGQMTSIAIYGCSMVVLFLCSTLYHSTTNLEWKALFNRFDHCAIYLLIAGSYTPFLTITLQSLLAHVLLVVIWVLAAAGIIFKIMYADRYPRFSLTTYLLMGWLSVIAIYQLYQVAPMPLIYLLIGGGVSYSVGTIFYAIERIPYHHAIWHVFVLGGAALHCLAIWLYVIP